MFVINTANGTAVPKVFSAIKSTVAAKLKK